MMKISADSTCDLSPELLKKWDISLLPLSILAGEQVFHDNVDITPRDVFAFAEKGILCKTAAVNRAEYEDFFRETLKKYDAIIHICISADFSSCYQNACDAAKEFQNVYVVDSCNLSTGSGHLVLDAAQMAAEGMKAEEIVKTLNETAGRVEASFVIDCVDFLHKGGRCSGVEAVGAKMFHIKPSILVENGAMHVGKKYRGKFAHALHEYVRDQLEGRDDIDDSRVFITHPMCAGETVSAVWEDLEKYGHFKEIYETHAGCTVSAHCGPNTLGILFKKKK